MPERRRSKWQREDCLIPDPASFPTTLPSGLEVTGLPWIFTDQGPSRAVMGESVPAPGPVQTRCAPGCSWT